MEKTGKVIINRTSGKNKGQWKYVLTGSNGEIIATSESYHNKADALSTIEKYFSSFELVDISDMKI